MQRGLASMPARRGDPGADDGGTTASPDDGRHLLVAALAAVVGVVVLAVGWSDGSLDVLNGVVGALFLAIAAVRVALARAG